MDTVATMPRCLLQHRAVLLWSMSIVCSFVSKSLQTIWSYVAEQQSLSKTEEKQRRQGSLSVNVGQEVHPGSECSQPPRKSCWREDTGEKYQEHSAIRNSFQPAEKKTIASQKAFAINSLNSACQWQIRYSQIHLTIRYLVLQRTCSGHDVSIRYSPCIFGSR